MTIEQWLADYDAGKEIETVEMGGIGIEYEAAIQELAVEIIRALQKRYKTVPNINPPINKLAAQVVLDLNEKHGFSVGQVGVAKNIAAVFWKQGIDKGLSMMREQEPERIIKFNKFGAVSR